MNAKNATWVVSIENSTWNDILKELFLSIVSKVK